MTQENSTQQESKEEGLKFFQYSHCSGTSTFLLKSQHFYKTWMLCEGSNEGGAQALGIWIWNLIAIDGDNTGISLLFIQEADTPAS